MVMTSMTMENQQAMNGKTHYFDWAMASIAMLVITTGNHYRNPFKNLIQKRNSVIVTPQLFLQHLETPINPVMTMRGQAHHLIV